MSRVVTDSHGYWRTCGYGGGDHLGHNSASMGGIYFCPRHLAALMTSFDPRPNDTVKYIDGEQAEYVVLDRHNDRVELRRMGNPDARSFGESIHLLYPAGHKAYLAVSRIAHCGKAPSVGRGAW